MFGPSPTFPGGPGGIAALGGGAIGYTRDLIWVDLRFAPGVGVGTEESPFNTANLGLGVLVAVDGGTLMMAGGDASTEPGVNIGARSLNARGLSGQSGSGGLGAVLPTLTYAITTGTQRLAFQNVSVALVHSGAAASLTQCYFEFCPTVTLTAGGDSTPVYWAGDAACTFSGSGGQLYFDGGNLAGYTANTGGITVRSGNITGSVTSPTSILILGGCTFSAVSLTAPSITLDPASYKNAVAAGVSFSSTVHVLVVTGTPVDTGTANAPGSGPALANFDHVHNTPFSAVNAALAGANATINVNNQRITGVGPPLVGTDVPNKTYVDAIAAGLKVKTQALVVATANQATRSGTAQTIDGVALNTIGMRVLLIGQSTATQNGLWLVQSGAWIRPVDGSIPANDFSTGSSAAQSYVLVTSGTANAGNSYFCTNAAGSDIVDTANLNWTIFSQAAVITAGAGLTKTGNTLDVVAGDATIVVHADDLVVGVIGNANLADNTIALARLANAGAQNDFLMRKTAGSGAWEDATLAQAQAALGITTSGALKSVRAATTANITLSGTQTVDGVALVATDRCLVKNQTTGANNGVYVVAAGAWTRATDAASAGQLFGGLLVPISEGTANGNQVAQLTTDDPITIGSTTLTFTMGRVAALGAVAPQDITDGAAQIGTSQFGTPIDHVHHLGFAVVAAVLAVASSSIAVNSQKITGLANGTVSTDAVNLGQVTSAISTALGAPANPGDNGKVAYANAGVLAYATGVTTSAGANLSVTSTASTGTVASTFKVTDAAHTALTASTERIGALFDFAQTRQFATGALTTQRALRVLAPTYSFVGASTITTAATVAISGAPVAGTNATLTNSLALWLEAGGLAFGTTITSGLVNTAHGVRVLAGLNNAGTFSVPLVRWGLLSNDLLWFGSTSSDPGKVANIRFGVNTGGGYSLDVDSNTEYFADSTHWDFKDNYTQYTTVGAGSATVGGIGLIRFTGNPGNIIGARNFDNTGDIALFALTGNGSTFNDLYVGDASAKGNSTLYLGALSQIVCSINAAAKYSYNATYADFTTTQIRFGTNPSTTAKINGPSGGSTLLAAQNLANSAAITCVATNSSNEVLFGDATNAPNVYTRMSGSAYWTQGSNTFARLDTNGLLLFNGVATYYPVTCSYVSLGALAAQSGVLRLPGNAALNFRNLSGTPNTLDLNGIKTDSFDNMVVGDNTNGVALFLDCKSSGTVNIRPGASTYAFDSAKLNMAALAMQFTTASAGSTTPSTTGLERFTGSPGTIIGARNFDNTGDIALIGLSGNGTTFNDMAVGDSGAKGNSTLYLGALGQLIFNINAAAEYSFTAAGADIKTNYFDMQAQSAPAAPGSGFRLFIDSNDNCAKFISSSGDITTIAAL